MFTIARVNYVKRTLCRIAPVLLAVGLTACGGYGGSNSYTPVPVAAHSNAARVSLGTITGFGSVHLNGIKFETTSAAITVNGQAATQNDLKVGQVVEVKGHHDDATGKDVADQIEFHHNVQGPVSVIDTNTGTLVVLGQTVIVNPETSFGDGINPAALAGIAVNDVIEVSGMAAANGEIQATRIEKRAAGAVFEVIGSAASTDANVRTLAINALTVNFSAAALVNFPPAGPKDGDLVEATGSSIGTAGELKATRLELLTTNASKDEVDADSEVEGLITRFASMTDFDVAGRPVATSGSTTFSGGAGSDLALNVHVEAEGTVDASGTLQATTIRIQLKSASATHLVGQADAVDTTAGTVTMLGVTVGVSGMTHFEDHGPQHVNTFSVADVHSGDWLDIRGSESAAGSSQVLATRFERIEQQPGVRLAGFVKSAAQPNFTILSVNVATTSTTQLKDRSGSMMSASSFFTNLVGQIGAVIGTWDGTILTAQQASLGEGDNN
jgi:hypothetical protein